MKSLNEDNMYDLFLMLLFKDFFAKSNHGMVLFLASFYSGGLSWASCSGNGKHGLSFSGAASIPFLDKVHTASMVYPSVSIGSALVFFFGLSMSIAMVMVRS